MDKKLFTYIDNKILMLVTEFKIRLSKKEKEHFRELKTENDVDRYAHEIFMRKL